MTQAFAGDRVVRAKLDAEILAAVRTRLPSLAHRRLRPETAAAVVPPIDQK